MPARRKVGGMRVQTAYFAAIVSVAAVCSTAGAPADPAGTSHPLANVLAADGPDKDLADRLQLFGQFVGNWAVDVVYHLPDGTTRLSKAEWHFGWILNGRAVQDVWMAPTRSEREAGSELIGYGTTVRYYDQRSDSWRVLWASVASGSVIVFTAREQGREIVMEAENSQPRTRWIFSDVTPDSFRWRAVEAKDADSWRTLQEMSARRVDRRDTLRDNLFASGPARGLEQQTRLFGQFVGDWTIQYEAFRTDGTVLENQGELHAGWILEGRAVQDFWGSRAGTPGKLVGGTTVRLYDPKIDAWHSVWIYPAQGLLQQFIARQHKEDILLDGSTPTGLPEQWIFSQITPTSFDWRAIESHDNRTTWQVTEHMRIRRAGSGQTNSENRNTVVWSSEELQWIVNPALAGSRQVALWGDATKESYGALKTIKAGTVVGPHTHSSLSRFVVLSGTLRFNVSAQAARNLGPQSYGSIPAGVVHSAICQESDCVYFEMAEGPYDFRPAVQQ
jgi:quercetin dioxygenase-like cupin family protein